MTRARSVSTGAAAKGDLVAGSGTNTSAILGVGANDTVLTADSSTATGLKWAAAGSATNFTLLNSGGTTMSGSSVTVSFSAQNSLAIRLNGVACSSQSYISLRFNSDSGSNYFFGQLYLANPSTLARDAGGADPQITIGRVSTNGLYGVFFADGAKSSTAFKPLSWTIIPSGTTSGDESRWGTGMYMSNNAITSVTLISGTGNFSGGSVFVYGG
jgi:hypothetical protein